MPFPSPGDVPDPAIELAYLASPAYTVGFIWCGLNPSSLLLQMSPKKQMGGSGLLRAQNPFLSGIKQGNPSFLAYMCK